jgi:hypothetical protein
MLKPRLKHTNNLGVHGLETHNVGSLNHGNLTVVKSPRSTPPALSRICILRDLIAKSQIIMETLMATLVFIPLSILIVEASFSAPAYPAAILSSVAGQRSYKSAREQRHEQKPIEDDDFRSQSGHANPVTVIIL